MADTEKKFHPSPEDLTKLKTSVDALVRRGAAREETRGLLEIFSNGNTWGLPDDHIDASRRVLRGFLERPYLFPEDVKDILGVVKQEERFTRVNWELRRKQVAVVSKRLSRLAVLTGLVIVGAFGAPPAINTVGDLYYQANLSPEAIARQQEENLQKQITDKENQLRKEQEQLQQEQAMVLGSDWTVESYGGWRFRYLPFDTDVEYQEVSYSGSSVVFNGGYYISVSKSPEERSLLGENKDDLWVLAGTHKRSNGETIPKLEIRPKSSSSTITVFLRNNNGSNLDTRVVHAYQTDSQREKYFKITVVPGKNMLQITQMTPVKNGA